MAPPGSGHVDAFLGGVADLLQAMEQRINARFDGIDRRFDALEQRAQAEQRRRINVTLHAAGHLPVPPAVDDMPLEEVRARLHDLGIDEAACEGLDAPSLRLILKAELGLPIVATKPA